MHCILRSITGWIAVAAIVSAATSGPLHADDKIVFDRDIRPILSDNCFACHGPDAKTVKADLRIDLRDNATKLTDGAAAIVPGKPDKSAMIERIFATDESVMPPPETNKKLTAKQKDLIKRWIAQGAEYTGHWSFSAAKRPQLPKVKDSKWSRNAIDRFILARLEAKGLTPSKEASRETLIRRVSLDLRGLPPTLKEIDQFLNDKSANAYEAMVDRMLGSRHYGEKMARIWMDLARYGDTNGYHYDSTRQAWLWRDYVIRAYNTNMRFDRFTIEQLAGDLLPNATIQQKVASGFNRNTRYNEEGGADPAEWRVEYAKDRVRTLGQVWLGMTVGCAECHSHKYDPVTQKEFYQLYAFFNSLDEPGAQGHRQKYPPYIKVPTAEHKQKLAALNAEITKIRAQITAQLAKTQYREPKNLPPAPTNKVADVIWIDDAPPAGAQLAGNTPWHWVDKGKHPVHSGNRATRRSGTGLTQHYFTGAKKPLVVTKGAKLFAWVYLDPKNPPRGIQLQFNDGSWEHRVAWGRGKLHGRGKGPQNYRAGRLPRKGKWVRLEVDAAKVGLKPGAKINGWAFTQNGGTVYYDTAGMSQSNADTRHLKSLALWEKLAVRNNGLPAAVRDALKIATAKRTSQQRQAIRDYYVEHVWSDSRKLFERLHKQIAGVEGKIRKAEDGMPFQLVSVELSKPRPAYFLIRGDFRKKGAKVDRETPKAFPAFPKDKPRNRLGLAHWLMRPDHPLTARVTVNRYWAQLFGRGIVETIGDFGHLGRYPTHPQLLNWLAVEFVESGWDTKRMLKLMVMSAAYRQSSVNDGRHAKADPDNKLLWRSPRFRLPAEEIRDSSLQIAGMLSPKIGGPPVFPYQPKDYYKGKKGGWAWNLSTGEDRYRRGMYTFWRRTTPYPTFIIFDAPDRSSCTVARPRTNTPLQALATMNDPQFVEASRVLGQRVLLEGPKDVDGRLAFAFRIVTSRKPNKEEMTVLREAHAEQQSHYKKNIEAAKSLVQAGNFTKPKGLDPVQHATWTAIANALLNLDETITRE